MKGCQMCKQQEGTSHLGFCIHYYNAINHIVGTGDYEHPLIEVFPHQQANDGQKAQIIRKINNIFFG